MARKGGRAALVLVPTGIALLRRCLHGDGFAAPHPGFRRPLPHEGDRGLEAYPGATTWLVYPWEPGFAAVCETLPMPVRDILEHVGRDDEDREVLMLRLIIGQAAAEVPELSQQALCALHEVAQAVGWTHPKHQGKMFRMKIIVDCSSLTSLNWLPQVRRIVGVINAINPFVSPFYDRLPGLIAIVDPPAFMNAAWALVNPLLGKPTREVVRFWRSSDLGARPPQPGRPDDLQIPGGVGAARSGDAPGSGSGQPPATAEGGAERQRGGAGCGG